LARDYGISNVAIKKRAVAEGWADVAEVQRLVHVKVQEKVTGITAQLSTERREAAIETESDRLAAVQLRQRQDWVEVKALLDQATARHENADVHKPEGGRLLTYDEIQANAAARRSAAEELKAVKVYAETVKIIQDGERKAWDMDAPFEVSKMTDEELEKALGVTR
jgi:hypothetical protein